LKPDGTRWRTGGEVKGKLANGVGSQYSHTSLDHGLSSITTADAHNSAASSGLNWRPRRFKWTRPFRRETKSGFCSCAITFQKHYTDITWYNLDIVSLLFFKCSAHSFINVLKLLLFTADVYTYRLYIAPQVAKYFNHSIYY